MKPRIAVVGPGRVGKTLARALERAGYGISGLVDKGEDPGCLAEADVVLVTVPDDDIAGVHGDLVERGAIRDSHIVFHCSGLVASSALVHGGFSPAGRASVHPMMAFADPESALASLPGTTYGVEGDVAGIEAARAMVGDLGGEVVIVPEKAKAAYHLACALSSNGLVALTDAAIEIMRGAGIEGGGVEKGLATLVRGTARNMAKLGVRPAMTGPVVRGDARTVASHLEVLGGGRLEVLEAYRILMLRLVEMAVESGRGDRSRYESIVEMLRR